MKEKVNMSESNTTQLLHQVEKWGYYQLPRSHPHSPGYTGLLVAIREAPTERHFDPEKIRLQILDEDGIPQRMTFGLEQHLAKSRQVCTGRVILQDRRDKEVEFFTFGGSIESVSVPGETVYSLRSTAPILQLTDEGESIPNLLAAETEVLIAKQRVRWRADDEGFGMQLAQVGPLQFYVATVSSLLACAEQTSVLPNEIAELYTVLCKERSWLEETGQWPDRLLSLEQLLSP